MLKPKIINFIIELIIHKSIFISTRIHFSRFKTYIIINYNYVDLNSLFIRLHIIIFKIIGLIHEVIDL